MGSELQGTSTGHWRLWIAVAAPVAGLVLLIVLTFRPVSPSELVGRYRCVRNGGNEDLVIRADGTCELGRAAGGRYVVETGTWTYNADRIGTNTPLTSGGVMCQIMGARRRIGGGVILEFDPDEDWYFRKLGPSARPLAE